MEDGQGDGQSGHGGSEEEDGGAEKSESSTIVADEDMESLRDELESVAVSRMYDDGSNASPVYQRSQTSGDEESSRSEFSDEERYRAWEEEMEIQRRRRGW